MENTGSLLPTWHRPCSEGIRQSQTCRSMRVTALAQLQRITALLQYLISRQDRMRPMKTMDHRNDLLCSCFSKHAHWFRRRQRTFRQMHNPSGSYFRSMYAALEYYPKPSLWHPVVPKFPTYRKLASEPESSKKKLQRIHHLTLNDARPYQKTKHHA